MEDRFKFRVWHKPLKIMHYNDFVITPTGYVAPIQEEVKGIDYMMRFNQQDLEFDKQCEVMQCTGREDKNGKLIYDLDIVDYEGYKFIILWNACMCGFVLQRINDKALTEFYLVDQEDIEVLGNVYENPELLKGGD